MKKIIFAFWIIITSTVIFAQEKGFHLTLGGNVGQTGFSYKLNSGTPNPGLGFGAFVGAQYYFNKYVGVSVGLDFSSFNTYSYFEEKKMTSDKNDSCKIIVSLVDWKENQRTLFFEIPLLMKFQYKWGAKELHGFYFGLGLKIQIPFSSFYKTTTGTVSVSAEAQPAFPLDEEYNVPFPWNSLETKDKKFWSGENQLKRGSAIIGEAGLLIGLSRRVSLMFGVSADYGFGNLKQNTFPLLEKVNNKTNYKTSIDDQPEETVKYNGVLNSKETKIIYPFSVRGNVGLKIKRIKSRKHRKK